MADDDFGPMGHPQRMPDKDAEGLPERAKLGNAERPERVPTGGHQGSVAVDEGTWTANNRRKDSADGLVGGGALQE